MACHKTRSKANRQLRALYANEPALKARISGGPIHPFIRYDVSETTPELFIPAIKDSIIKNPQRRREIEARRQQKKKAITQKSSLTVFKDSTGRYRWVAFSSNAYRDRDGEIVSTKALEDDVARADTDGDYGPLRWWHIQGADIGDCDYNAMHGRVLIESGTFRHEWIGERIKEQASDLQLSIGFLHPLNEPDPAGVFHHIRRFERSLVPVGKAANPWTRFFVQEATHMLKEKISGLATLLGISPDRAEALIVSQAEMTEKALQDAGVVFKASAPTIAIDTEDATEAPETPGEIPDAEDVAEAPEPASDPAGDPGITYVGDMEPEPFAQLIAATIRQELAPLVSALDITKTLGGHMDELKGMMGSYTAKKDAEGSEQSERLAALEAAITANAAQAEHLKASLKELEGDQPRAVKGYRASQDPATAIQDGSALKASAPSADPVVEFFGSVNVLGNGPLPAS